MPNKWFNKKSFWLGWFIFCMCLIVLPLFMVSKTYAASSFTRYYYGSNYTFKVFVPSSYSGSSTPLVVMLHGCTQNADDFAAGTKMNALAEEKGFLVLYPEMNPAANLNRCWNWFYDSNQHRGSGEPAIINGMVDWVKNNYNINGSKVYVSGMSAGGAMSVIMGATYPDVFQAVGVHSGLEYDATDSAFNASYVMLNGGIDPQIAGKSAYLEMGSRSKKMPTIVFHGTSDWVVGVVNGNQVVTQWAQTNDFADDGNDNNSFDAIVDQTITGSTGGKTYTQYIYNDQNGTPYIEKWIINGLGHKWSGGSSSGSYTDPNGPDASRIMWDFFINR